MSSVTGRATPQNQRIESHLPLARQIAARYAGRGEPVDDLVQVGALGLMRASERYDPSRGASFSTFAARVIDGEIRRHLRARKGIPTLTGADANDVADPYDGPSSSDDRVLLAASAAGLTETERQTVFLRFHADMTERDIASSLGLSQPAVSRILSRSLAKLRDELGTPDVTETATDTAPEPVIPHENPPPEPANLPEKAEKPRPGRRRGTRIGGVESRPRKRASDSRSGATGQRAEDAASYSGRFLVRLPSELHEDLALAARREHVSLNRFVTDALAAHTSEPAGDGAAETDAPSARPPRNLRVVLAANLALVAFTTAVAIVLLVLALERGL